MSAHLSQAKTFVAEEAGSVTLQSMSATPGPTPESGAAVQAPDAANLCLLLGQLLFNFGATAQRIKDSIACLIL